jgi:transposase-like protein
MTMTMSDDKLANPARAEVAAWQTRPLDAFYPIVYLDALVAKIRDGHHVQNRAAHIAVGVDTAQADWAILSFHDSMA